MTNIKLTVIISYFIGKPRNRWVRIGRIKGIPERKVVAKNELYTVKKAAEALGVSSKTLKNWERAGKIPSPKRNRLLWRVYTEEDIRHIRKTMRIDEIN